MRFRRLFRDLRTWRMRATSKVRRLGRWFIKENDVRCITNDPLPGAVLPTEEELGGGEGTLEALKPEPAPDEGEAGRGRSDADEALDSFEKNSTSEASKSESRGKQSHLRQSLIKTASRSAEGSLVGKSSSTSKAWFTRRHLRRKRETTQAQGTDAGGLDQLKVTTS